MRTRKPQSDGKEVESCLGVCTMQKQGFSLVELMVVVAILGILGALAMPVYTDHTTKAKEAAVRSNLGILRAQIELYRLHHKGVVPGYISTGSATVEELQWQFEGTTDTAGSVSKSKNVFGPFTCGPYTRKIPENPFNGLNTIIYVAAATEFSAAADGTSSGWLYKRETAEIRLNWDKPDAKGQYYYDY